MSRSASIVALLTLVAACAHKTPNTYRLVRHGQTPTLVPPGVARPDVLHRVLVSEIPAGKGPCTIEQQAIRLQPLKKKIRLTVDRNGLANQKQSNWLGDWALRAEEQGCIAPGESQNLATRIVESVPLDSVTAFRLVHPNGIQSGYVELGPENRIQVTTPILPAGVTEAPPAEIVKVTGEGTSLNVDIKQSVDVIGFERAWYGIQPSSSGAGYRFVPLSAERHVQGAVERASGPKTNYLQFSAEAKFYRLFHKIEANGVTALLIAGRSRLDLDRRTKAVGPDPVACEREEGLCLVLPKKLGINPYMVVSANGRDLAVSLGATVGSVLRAAGVAGPEAMVPRLNVSRLYRGRLQPVEFDRKSPDILNLTLMGLERITW